MAENNEKLRDDFLSESEELLEQFNRDLLAIAQISQFQGAEGMRADPDLLNSTFRGVHSLKGLAGLAGVERMRHLAHHLENLLDSLRLGRVVPTQQILDLLFESIEHFQLICAEVRVHGLSAGAAPSIEVDDYVARVNRAANPAAAQSSPPGTVKRPPQAPGSEPVLSDFDLDPSLIAGLSEAEESRLRENIRTGKHLYRVLGSFPLLTIDQELENLKAALKPVGEVIAFVPGIGSADPDRIDIEVILGSAQGSAVITGAIGNTEARVVQVARRAPQTGTLGLPPGASEHSSMFPTGRLSAMGPMTGAGVPVRPQASHPPKEPRPSLTGGGDLGGEDGGGRGEGGSTLKSVSQTVRVDIRKLDNLMNIVGELTLTRSGIQAVFDKLRRDRVHAELARNLQDELRALTRKLDDLQKGILEVRMVPMQQIFDKLARVVRRMEREAEGKQINFLVLGGETMLDKLQLEDLSDPLMHIIRNAIDHGIEPKTVREMRGKPLAGTVSISAEQRGNHVVLEVEDDGNGIDTDALVAKALERGMITEDQSRTMTLAEKYELMFKPNLSTRKTADQNSGRGVGMDVVKTNIKNMGGKISVASDPGQGTRMTITLPITLAIIRALVIRCADRPFAIQLTDMVKESLMIDYGQIRTVEGREMITLRDRTLSLVRLDEMFGLQRREGSPERRHGFVVVVELTEDHKLGLLVDDLVGQQDIVIKPLGKALQGIPGIAGATELGGQQTALVLDVRAVAEEAMPRVMEAA